MSAYMVDRDHIDFLVQSALAGQQRARARAIAHASQSPIHGRAGGGSMLTELALLIVVLVIVAAVLGVVVWPHVAPIFHTLQGVQTTTTTGAP